MNKYEFTAYNQNGEIVKGEIQSETQETAAQELLEKNLFISSISVKSSAIKRRAVKSNNASIKQNDIVNFTRQLSKLVQAGVKINKALEFLESSADKNKLKNLIKDLANGLNEGSTLSERMKKYPKHFSELYVNLTNIGEESGILDKCLNYIAEILQFQKKIRSKFFSSLSYPAVIVLVGLSVIFFMSIFIIPNFADSFQNLGLELPAPTRIILRFSEFAIKFKWLIVVMPFIIYFSIKYILKIDKIKKMVDRFLLRIPMLSELLIKSYTAQTFFISGLLLNSGLPLLKVIELIIRCQTNHAFKSGFIQTVSDLKEGVLFSKSLEDNTVIPMLAIQFIKVGEESGEIGDVMIDAGKTYQNEIFENIEKMTSIIEPLALILIGAAIALIMLAVFLPLLQMSQNI